MELSETQNPRMNGSEAFKTYEFKSFGKDPDDFARVYDYLGYFELISQMSLDEINVEVAVGFTPKQLLLWYSIIIVISFLGIVGNVLSIIIWTRPQLKSSSAVLLTALALCDIVVLLSYNTWQMLGTLIVNFKTDFFEYLYYNIFYYVVVWMDPFISISVMASMYLTVAITIERYIAVCHPFSYRELCSYGRAWKTSAGVIIVSILFNLDFFWMAEVHPIEIYDKNVTVYGLRLKGNWEDGSLIKAFYLFIENGTVYFLVTYIIPLASIVLFNVAMFREFRKEKKERELTDLQKKERRLTKMLIYVVLEFFVCTAVMGIIGVLGRLDISRNELGVDLFWSAPLLILSTTFNSSVNFVTYIKFGGPFRRTFIEVFSCCRGFD